MELPGLSSRILIVELFLASGEAHMRRIIKAVFFAVFLLTSAIVSLGQSPASKDARGSLVVVFKDGHSQSFSLADIVRIEFSAPARIVFRDGHQQSLALNDTSRIEFGSSALGGSLMGKNHFLGKWKVGVGGGGGHFFITLKADGEAAKTIGANHGTWTVVDGEARISWDDGWHDVIRRAGIGHEKAAFEPGKTFSDEPTNVADATRIDGEPI